MDFDLQKHALYMTPITNYASILSLTEKYIIIIITFNFEYISVMLTTNKLMSKCSW